MKSRILTVLMVIGAMLFLVVGVTGCSSCGWCSKKTEVKQCAADCKKPCCAKKATAKQCSKSLKKACSLKTAVKKCAADCKKPCCVKTASKPASCPMM